MKNIFLFSLMIACLVSFGKCNKKKRCSKKKATTETAAKLNSNEVWMQYDETKCANPWQFNWFQKPTDAQVLGAIQSDLIGKEIAVLEIRSSTEKDFMSCDACDCPTGTHYFVRVNKSEMEELRALKFFETKDVPNSTPVSNSK